MGQYPSIHSDACIFSISFNKDVEPTSLEELNNAEREWDTLSRPTFEHSASQTFKALRTLLPRFHSKRNYGAGISQLAWRSNLAMVVLPMGATGPMQVGLQRLEAVRPWQHIFMRRCARVDRGCPEGWTCRGGVTTCGGLSGCPLY